MKILRDTEWEPIAWVDYMPGIEGPAFLFKHKKYGDIQALKVAKWIDVSANIVHFYRACTHEVSVSGKEEGYQETCLPTIHMVG